MIRIQNLSFSYADQEVLQKINLTYHSSQFLGIIGSNGGGKSTLIKLILRLLPLQNGILQAPPSHHIGYVPQHISNNPNFPLRVFDLVLMGRTRSFGRYNKNDKARAFEALEILKISSLADQKFDSLSGGQKQKALIARALCADSKILILDEPTASIDAHATLEIFELLSKLHHNGIGIIAVCHDLNLLLSYATHIACLQTTLKLFAIPEQQEDLLAKFACKHHLKGACDA